MIFCVEDDDNIRDLIVYTLENTGFQAQGFEDGKCFRAALGHEKPDLVLMDVMLPGEDGVSLLKDLRANSETEAIPVIMVTAKGAEFDKVKALDLGADDYVTKPFNPAELMARVRSQLRRYTALGGMMVQEQSRVYRTGGLVIDDAAKSVTVDGEPVSLTPREYGILAFLTKHAGQVFSISQIYEAVWNETAYSPENTVAVHIRRIREKIEINPKEPKYLKVVWGIGYKMEKLHPKLLG